MHFALESKFLSLSRKGLVMKVFKFIHNVLPALLLLLVFNAPAASDQTGKSNDYIMARKNMVLYQIRHRGIKDPDVLDAMESVLRHELVRDAYKSKAYDDTPLPIGYGQTISQPYIVALMTALLNVDNKARVLEVGTGSGYQAAVLARIVDHVYTVEIVKPLHDRANKDLKRLGHQNIHTLNADGYFGWKEKAPFDAVIVTCASDFIPPPLIEQLRPGGRMCIPVGPPFKVQHLVLVKKSIKGVITSKIITSVRFVPLTRNPVKNGK